MGTVPWFASRTTTFAGSNSACPAVRVSGARPLLNSHVAEPLSTNTTGGDKCVCHRVMAPGSSVPTNTRTCAVGVLGRSPVTALKTGVGGEETASSALAVPAQAKPAKAKPTSTDCQEICIMPSISYNNVGASNRQMIPSSGRKEPCGRAATSLKGDWRGYDLHPKGQTDTRLHDKLR